jgi:8-oxo-dGTP pyrophosphatase MutT (NUDIX family)
MEQNPWKTIAAKEVYENPWIKITEFDVINPNGGKGIYGKVHFKNKAIGVVVLDEDENTFLIGQFRYTLNQYSWEIPEGGGPEGEEPLDTAKRELLEEAGITANNWEKILDIHTSNSVTDEFGHIFLATDLRFETAAPEETEELKLLKIPFEKAYKMVLNGEITDSLSIAAILHVKILLLEKKISKD